MKSSRLRRLLHPHAMRRNLSLKCRGLNISRDQLFQYTNGSFLVDENKALSRRYLKFDLDALCSIAASAGSSSPVSAVEKMEGGFSKALLLTKDDGSEIVAKLPFSIAGPPRFTTASEVAILQYVAQYTRIPVPKVLAWSCDPSNAVGAEYIIMEKAPGVQLVKAWASMPDYDHFMLIKNLCALESELASLEFPAHGSLYLRQSLSSTDACAPLESQASRDKFCIGPSCEKFWSMGHGISRKNGPWMDLSGFGQAIVDCEISRIHSENNDQRSSSASYNTTAEQLLDLEIAREVMKRMSAESLPGRFSRPTLWHTDLHFGNIYVLKEDPTKIVSIIDWQSLSVKPLFCQVRFPEFLELPDEFEIGGPVPKRPENLDEMDEDERVLAQNEHKQACMGRAYEAASRFKNKQVSKALQLPVVFKDLFERCREVSEEGSVPLRACLVELSKIWEDSGCTGSCPIQFTPEQLAKHDQEFEDYTNFHRIRAIARDLLGTDSEGWLPPSVDATLIKQQNQELLRLMETRSAEYGKTPEEVRKIWPFHTS